MPGDGDLRPWTSSMAPMGRTGAAIDWCLGEGDPDAEPWDYHN